MAEYCRREPPLDTQWADWTSDAVLVERVNARRIEVYGLHPWNGFWERNRGRHVRLNYKRRFFTSEYPPILADDAGLLRSDTTYSEEVPRLDRPAPDLSLEVQPHSPGRTTLLLTFLDEAVVQGQRGEHEWVFLDEDSLAEQFGWRSSDDLHTTDDAYIAAIWRAWDFLNDVCQTPPFEQLTIHE